MKRGIVVVLTHQPSKETFAMKVVVNHSHLSREVFDNIYLVLVFVTLFKFLWSRAYYDFLSDKFQPSVYISGSVACLHARCQLAQQSWWPRYQTRDLNKCLAFGSEKQPTLPNLWIKNFIPNSTRDYCKVQILWELKKSPTLFWNCLLTKAWTFWEAHKIWKKNLHGFDKSADLLSKRENHEEDFFF